jgi:serine/threonine protein kinase
MVYLHCHGIVHRDLKPSHILLDDNFRPYICGFRWCKIIPPDDLVQFSDPMVGTPLYMSPELILSGEYSFPADVYSWSFIYYELIVGKRPFFECDRLSPSRLFKAVIDGNRPKRTSEITDKQWEVLGKCWNANPKERLTFEELIENPDLLKFPNCDDREFNDYLEFIVPALRNP